MRRPLPAAAPTWRPSTSASRWIAYPLPLIYLVLSPPAAARTWRPSTSASRSTAYPSPLLHWMSWWSGTGQRSRRRRRAQRNMLSVLSVQSMLNVLSMLDVLIMLSVLTVLASAWHPLALGGSLVASAPASVLRARLSEAMRFFIATGSEGCRCWPDDAACACLPACLPAWLPTHCGTRPGRLVGWVAKRVLARGLRAEGKH